MLPLTATSIRLFLHVLAASVWVGGQLTLGGLIPAVRPAGVERVRAVAQQFQRIAWPAFAVVLLTGIWNLAALHVGDQSGRWLTTLLVKLLLVAASGLAAALHIFVAAPRMRAAQDDAERRRAAALSGAFEGMSVLAGLGAMLLGVMLHG